jgi:hypothetical protein
MSPGTTMEHELILDPGGGTKLRQHQNEGINAD